MLWYGSYTLPQARHFMKTMNVGLKSGQEVTLLPLKEVQFFTQQLSQRLRLRMLTNRCSETCKWAI
jgi:hypothetical protein